MCFIRFPLLLSSPDFLMEFRGDGSGISEAVKQGGMNRFSLQIAAAVGSPVQESCIPLPALALPVSQGRMPCQRGHSPAHVASALCPCGGACIVTCTILNPVWAGNGHSPYRRMGRSGYHLMRTRQLSAYIAFPHRSMP